MEKDTVLHTCGDIMAFLLLFLYIELNLIVFRAKLQNCTKPLAASSMLSNNGCSGLLVDNTNADAAAAPTNKPKHT